MSTYICDLAACQVNSKRGWFDQWSHCWHESTFRRLEWQYGRERAIDVMAGRHGPSNADLSAWNRLGG